MAKNSVKKSDKGKEWLNKRKNRYIKSKLEYHLIVCEGTETEPNYFQALKEKISNNEKITIKIVGKRRGTTNLLEEAKKDVLKSTNYISNVWLVYDKDDFSNESFDKVIEECKKINQQEGTIYNAIWSNESIETWILLHFIKFDTPMGRRDCIRKINENFKRNQIGKYLKNDKFIYDKLETYLSDAINNAKWLDSKYTEDKKPSTMNPCTKVYKLVELLNKYIDSGA